MYTDIGLPHIGIDQILEFVKEAHEIYPNGFVRIIFGAGESLRDARRGGYVSYEYSKDLPVRNTDELSPSDLESYQRRSNPNLYAAYKDSRFQDLCRKHGIEPVIDIPV